MSIAHSALPAAAILTGVSETIMPLSITKKTSFADHLLWQLHLHDLSDQEMEIGEYIIGNINKDGYLLLTPDEVAADLGVERQCVEDVAEELCRFDPVGVAAL